MIDGPGESGMGWCWLRVLFDPTSLTRNDEGEPRSLTRNAHDATRPELTTSTKQLHLSTPSSFDKFILLVRNNAYSTYVPVTEQPTSMTWRKQTLLVGDVRSAHSRVSRPDSINVNEERHVVSCAL
jgi:hypothetical protein